MSRVVKGAPAAGRRIEGAVFDAAAEARALRAAAEADAARIRADALAERARVHAEAAEAGRQEGLGRAAAALATATQERARLLAGLEGEVASLALEVAGRLLGRTLALEPALVVELAAAALVEARDRREVALRVSPADAPALRAAEGRLAALLARAPGLSVREDPSLGAGQVVVETEGGTLDARVEAQLAELARALEDLP
jgi:flagellar biosynthesis/type III secretory pathway protein FliH